MTTSETRTVVVQFAGSTKRYHYLWDGEVRVGDLAAVRVRSGGGQDDQLLAVREVLAGRSPQATRWLMGVIDPEAWERRQRIEVERRRVRAQLEEEARRQAEAEQYRRLASSATGAALLERLAALDRGELPDGSASADETVDEEQTEVVVHVGGRRMGKSNRLYKHDE